MEMLPTFAVIAFIVIVAVIAWRHNKKLKTGKTVTDLPPAHPATDEQQDRFDNNHPNL